MLIDKIQELKNLTTQEQAVVDHILNNPRDLLEMNVYELAQASYTSPSTIIRFCKKLDINGFVDFKYLYVSEYQEMEKQRKKLKRRPFTKETSIDEIINTIPLVYDRALSHTKSLLSKNTIIRITNLMKQADRIEIYGDSANFDLGRVMAYRFEAVNKDCFVYNAAHWEHIRNIKFRDTKTVAILLSHTGKNPMILDAAKMLKESGIKTVSISGNWDMALANLTDENIQIMNSENELELKTTIYSIGVQYILDICVSSLMVHQIDDVYKVASSLQGKRESWGKE